MFEAVLALVVAAAQAPAADDPRSKAAEGASFVFGQACLLRLNVKQTAAAFAAGSDVIGRGVLADTPALKGVLAIDGAEGRGCRVIYTGDQADLAWRGFGSFQSKVVQGPASACTTTATSADRLVAACVSTAPEGDPTTETRHADLTITRTGAGAQGSVTAMLSNVRP